MDAGVTAVLITYITTHRHPSFSASPGSTLGAARSCSGPGGTWTAPSSILYGRAKYAPSPALRWYTIWPLMNFEREKTFVVKS